MTRAPSHRNAIVVGGLPVGFNAEASKTWREASGNVSAVRSSIGRSRIDDDRKVNTGQRRHAGSFPGAAGFNILQLHPYWQEFCEVGRNATKRLPSRSCSFAVNPTESRPLQALQTKPADNQFITVSRQASGSG
jgi:hypothetical protein